jgi:hypothetical protein
VYDYHVVLVAGTAQNARAGDVPAIDELKDAKDALFIANRKDSKTIERRCCC